MELEIWEHFFKSEVRNSGRTLVAKEQVRLGRPSDTELVSYVRGSSNFKVVFRSDSMDSPIIKAACSCPVAQKGQSCKHMWAVLSVVAETHPDFLVNKTEFSIPSADALTAKEKPKISQEYAEKQQAYKQKQADYRKQQYQLQKERQKSFKKSGKIKEPVQPEYPEDVAVALAFFSENGFPLDDDLNAEVIGLARKKLARVFHPDRGGSHEEIVELNKHTDVLLRYSDNE